MGVQSDKLISASKILNPVARIVCKIYQMFCGIICISSLTHSIGHLQDKFSIVEILKVGFSVSYAYP